MSLDHYDRRKAERSMDTLNERMATLLAKSSPLTHVERQELQQVQRQLSSARRNVRELRERTR